MTNVFSKDARVNHSKISFAMSTFALNGLTGPTGRTALTESQNKNVLAAKKNDSECAAKKMDALAMQLNMIR